MILCRVRLIQRNLDIRELYKRNSFVRQFFGFFGFCIEDIRELVMSENPK